MKVWVAVVLLLAAGSAVAQQHQHGHSPYPGSQTRSIKALSGQQVADLRAGRGMGLALAAELNGYPGPLHVLELADRLELTAGQRGQVQQLYDAMKSEAIEAGERLIADERELDRQFAEGTMKPTTLAALTARIGETQGQLRAVHLKYHLTTAELLTPDQKRRYAELRGYR
jgi:Spy/CpxP family protein refolding chaperone